MARSRASSERRGALAWLGAIAVLMAVLLAAAPAAAHEVGLSRGEYVVAGATVDAEIIFSRGEIASLVAGLDADQNGRLTPEEVAGSRAALGRVLIAGITVQGGGADCPGAIEDARLVDEDGLAVRLRFRCRARSAQLAFSFPVLQDLAYGHRHIAHVVAGPILADHVLHRRSPSFEVAIAGAEAPEPPRSDPPARSPLVAGLLEMITGLDHLAFVVGLVLLGGRPRSILLGAMGLAALQALGLALGALDVLSPAPGFVGPAIALSVAYVGIEGWAADGGAERRRFALPLGLLHGFGFAGALGRMASPAARLPGALAGFTLGVEAGLVAILGVVVPLFLYARKRERLARYGRKGSSVILAAAGVIWFVIRLRSGIGP